MKRNVLFLFALLMTLGTAAQGNTTPAYLTQGYQLSLLGYKDADDADDNLRQQLRAYEFHTPDTRVNSLGALLSVAAVQKGDIEQNYQRLLRQVYGPQPPLDSLCLTASSLLTRFFGIRNQGKGRQRPLRPSFPANWDYCTVRTPDVDYTFYRQGSEMVFNVVRRQPVAKSFVQRYKSSSQIPLVTFHSAYDDTAIPAPGLEEPTFEERFRPQRIETLLTDSIPFAIDPEFLIEKEYIVRGVPFLVPLTGNNIANVAFPEVLTIPLSTKAHRAWLLLSDTPVSRDPHQSKALIIASYQDGTADILPLINPDNWKPLASGQARRLCLQLNADKKLAAIRIRPLAEDVTIGLMAVTLQ